MGKIADGAWSVAGVALVILWTGLSFLILGGILWLALNTFRWVFGVR